MEDIDVPMSHVIAMLHSTIPEVAQLRGKDNSFIPQSRVAKPSIIPGKGSPSIFLQIFGIAELKVPGQDNKMLAMVSWPVGVGKSSATVEELLTAVLTLKITVERTAYSKETLIIRSTGEDKLLKPWERVMKRGAAFPAHKICPSSCKIPAVKRTTLRVIHVDTTVLTSKGFHLAPQTMAQFKTDSAVALNLRIVLEVSENAKARGISGTPVGGAKMHVDVILHLGLLKRQKEKQYNAEYARRKLNELMLDVSLGFVAGVSVHVSIRGRMTKTLKASLGGTRHLMYPLMDVQSTLNSAVWLKECNLVGVHGLVQASSIGEFKYFPSVSADISGTAIKARK